MGRKKKHNRAIRFYHIQTNDLIHNTLQIFKLFRPDLRTYQQVIDYAYNMFLDDFYSNNIFQFEYEMLETLDKDFKRRISYCYSYQEHKESWNRVHQINKKFKMNINKSEMFRRAIYYMFSKYNLFEFNKPQPLLQEFNPENLEEFISELEPEIQREIREALMKEMHEELTDDKTLEVENSDDKTLEIENKDDKTVEVENTDDTTIFKEICEDYDLYTWEE